VTQDDQQPDGTPRSGISRDTLLLLGALTFLILAVALTFLFTPNSGPLSEPSTTAVAELPTTATGPYPSPGASGPYPVESATADSGAAAPTSGTYPGPVGEATTLPAATPEVPPSEGTTPGSIPTGDPLAEATATAGQAGGQIATATTEPYPGPVGDGTPVSQPTFNPTVIQPTQAPPVVQPTQGLPTSAPPVAQPTQAPPVVQPTQAPTTGLPPTPTKAPTGEIELDPTAAPGLATTVPPPAAPAADVLRGNVRWAAGQSPIILKRDVQIAPGAELIIEPGVEVRLDPGVSIYVDGGRLLALGLPGQGVRFVGTSSARWSGIFGRPNSFVVLENTEVRGGGAGGTVMAMDRSELVVRSSRFTDNGGSILATDTKLEFRGSEVSGNDMPFGPAIEASYGRGNFVTFSDNRFGGNRLSEGAPQVRFINSSTYDTLNLAIEGNLVRGGSPNLQLATNGPLKGAVACNALIGDAQGFGLRTQTPQVAPNGVPPMELRVENNYMDEHIPPIIPVYLRYGLGRGATSEIMLDMRNNWWGEASGPYEPDQNADGRGDSVGANIIFAPWLTAAPSCVPAQ
jgi:hypothetical protein